MIKGSCLCGEITYELSAPPELMNLCHCTMCRKVTGSAYGVFAHLQTNDFNWISGENKIRYFQSSAENKRAFCANCGASVPVVAANDVCIPAGSFDDDPGVQPVVQIFTGSKAPWYDISAKIPAFDEFPDLPGWDGDDT